MSGWLNKFPSLNDVIESAPLKPLLSSKGRAQLMADTTRYLDQLRVQAQTASRRYWPQTTQELAERVARWIDLKSPQVAPAFLNATGTLFSSEGWNAPISAATVDALVRRGQEFQRANAGDEALQVIWQRLTGAEMSITFSSASSALAAGLVALAANKQIVTQRGRLERDASEPSPFDYSESLRVAIREVGTANNATLADYEQALAQPTGLILESVPRWTHNVGESHRPSIQEVSTLARRANVPFVVDMGWGGLFDVTSHGITAWPTIAAAFDQGANVVVLRGHGLLGGPACGILLGPKRILQTIVDHPLAKTMLADGFTRAALQATLTHCDSFENASLEIPLLRLLTTSLENLKQRAERLAPQIAALGLASSASATSCTSAIATGLPSDAQPASWAIALEPLAGQTPSHLMERLAQGTTPIRGRMAGNQVLLDLRSLPAHDDLTLIETLTQLVQPPTASS